MTDTQAKQINEMRMRGMGYKAIGMAIGLSRDIVRNYCKRHNLAGYATVVSKNMKLMVDGKEVCHSAVIQSNSQRLADRDGSAVKMQKGMVESTSRSSEEKREGFLHACM